MFKLHLKFLYFLCTLFIRPANGSLNPGAAGLVVVLAGLVDPVGVEVGGPPPPAGPAGLAAAEAAAADNSFANGFNRNGQSCLGILQVDSNKTGMSVQTGVLTFCHTSLSKVSLQSIRISFKGFKSRLMNNIFIKQVQSFIMLIEIERNPKNGH